MRQRPTHEWLNQNRRRGARRTGAYGTSSARTVSEAPCVAAVAVAVVTRPQTPGTSRSAPHAPAEVGWSA